MSCTNSTGTFSEVFVNLIIIRSVHFRGGSTAVKWKHIYQVIIKRPLNIDGEKGRKRAGLLICINGKSANGINTLKTCAERY